MARTTGRGRIRQCVCERCGVTFETRGRATRFCSNRCSAAHRWTLGKFARGEVTCLKCGKKFHGQLVDWENKPRRKYCSSYCYGVASRKGSPTFTCAHCGTVTPYKMTKNGGFWYGQRHCSKLCATNAQRTGSIDRRGYRVFTFGGKQVPEHRLVMERVLGRKLLPYETVHHKDADRLNNDPSNLEVWIGRHTPGARLTDAIAWATKLLCDHGYVVTAPSS